MFALLKFVVRKDWIFGVRFANLLAGRFEREKYFSLTDTFGGTREVTGIHISVYGSVYGGFRRDYGWFLDLPDAGLLLCDDPHR